LGGGASTSYNYGQAPRLKKSPKTDPYTAGLVRNVGFLMLSLAANKGGRVKPHTTERLKGHGFASIPYTDELV
jgi:hypothetical protein